MSDKKNEENTDLTEAVASLKDNKSTEAQQAVEAIEMTSRVMDAIMAGRQLDLAFYGAYASSSIKKIKRTRIKRKSKKKD